MSLNLSYLQCEQYRRVSHFNPSRIALTGFFVSFSHYINTDKTIYLYVFGFKRLAVRLFNDFLMTNINYTT